MQYYISSGAMETFHLHYDDELSVLSGGTSLSSHIASGAVEIVESDGVSDGDVISSGGYLDVYQGGLAENDHILSGGFLGLGGNADNVIISDGGVLAIDLTIQYGSTFIVSNGPSKGATVSGATLQSGSILDIEGATIASGATLSLRVGSEVGDDVYVEKGGLLTGQGKLVYGYETPSTIDYGDISGLTFIEEQAESATGIAVVVSSGGVIAASAIISGEIYIASRGKAEGVIIGARGDLIVDDGAVTSGSLLSAKDGAQQEDYGIASATTVALGGLEFVNSGGRSFGSLIQSGGIQQVLNGGLTSGATVLAGGHENFGSGARAENVTISSGGYLDLKAITAGETIILTSTALSNETKVGQIDVKAGAYITASGAVVERGGVLDVGSGSGVNELGILIVSSGGKVIGSGVIGGYIFVSGGQVSGVTLGSALGFTEADLYSGATATDVTIDGSATLSAASGARVSNVLVSGGNLALGLGAVAENLHVMAHGDVDDSYAIIRGASISAGGSLGGSGDLMGDIIDSGMVEGVTIGAGAQLHVASGAEFNQGTVGSGGSLFLSSGAEAIYATIQEGAHVLGNGVLIDSNTSDSLGGTVDGRGDYYFDGQTLLVTGDLSGFNGTFHDEAGNVELFTSGGRLGKAIEFTSGYAGTLDFIGSSAPPVGTAYSSEIIDFSASGEVLDLSGINYTSSATVTLNNSTLVVKDGAYSAKFRLSGSMATAYIAVADSAGGTEIEVRPLTNASLVEAAAGFPQWSAAPDMLAKTPRANLWPTADFELRIGEVTADHRS